MIALIVFISFFVLSVYVCVKERREQDRILNEVDAKRRMWLDKQESLPKHGVQLVTKSGKIYMWPGFPPSAYSWVRPHTFVPKSSLDVAEEFILNSFKNEYFHHVDTNTFIPICEIREVQTIEYKQ